MSNPVALVLVIVILVTTSILFFSLSSRDRRLLFSRYETIMIDDKERSYLISKTKKITDNTNVYIGLHGYTDSARRFAYYTGLHNVVEDKDIVIYPQAIQPLNTQKRGWNAGFCCGSGWKQGVDDVEFITKLVEEIIFKYDLNMISIYVTGFSNGSFMAMKLATEKPELVSAVAGVSGTIGTVDNKLTPIQPLPIMLVHGKQDKTVPYEGGVTKSDSDFNWLSFKETFNTWQKVNHNKAETKKIVYDNTGHQWKNWRIFKPWHKKPSTSVEIIDFLKNK